MNNKIAKMIVSRKMFLSNDIRIAHKQWKIKYFTINGTIHLFYAVRLHMYFKDSSLSIIWPHMQPTWHCLAAYVARFTLQAVGHICGLLL